VSDLPSPLAAGHAGAAVQVLWAEDAPDDQYLIRAAMDALRSRAKVTFVDDGAAVLAHLADTPSDLVVLDMDMPGMGGVETLRRIRRGRPGAKQPVAMFSDRFDDELTGADRTACTAYIQKPVDFNAFIAAVGKILQTSVARQAQGRALLTTA
jgi:CheY-like chemotaxis protein